MIRALVLGSAIAATVMPSGGHHPTLRVEASGRLVWAAVIAQGERFDLAFEHSSEHCRWTQHYAAGSGGTFRQLSSTFPCYGPGMPAAVSAGTTLGVSADGFTVAAPLELRELRMMNSRQAALHLVYRGRVVPLEQLLEEFEIFTLSVG
jgi:hypothetical protein